MRFADKKTCCQYGEVMTRRVIKVIRLICKMSQIFKNKSFEIFRMQ